MYVRGSFCRRPFACPPWQLQNIYTVVFLKIRLRHQPQEHKRRIIFAVSPHFYGKNDECSNNCAPVKRNYSLKNDEMSNNCSRLSPSAVHRLSHQLCAMAGRATAATAERSAPHLDCRAAQAFAQARHSYARQSPPSGRIEQTNDDSRALTRSLEHENSKLSNNSNWWSPARSHENDECSNKRKRLSPLS